MPDLLENAEFANDYAKLRAVSLNSERHTAANAFEHSELVYDRALQIGRENECTDEQLRLLGNLARAHDIGKITGRSWPSRSLKLLERYGIDDPRLLAMVKHHDLNLPWFKSAQQGEAPGPDAWLRLSQSVDIRLLCLFMIADRVDCPGGWKANKPLMWFLAEASLRGHVRKPIRVDSEPVLST